MLLLLLIMLLLKGKAVLVLFVFAVAASFCRSSDVRSLGRRRAPHDGDC